ncbi:cell division protein FtsK [Neisseria weixii]|uniref:Cell division protein FtsK n=1 Tax=Neisseria weixii TaxID=1853276 RepID=A0A3N4N6M4_9NEIS|nr:DNA translocase FtsK [Neisseria weixii]RPD86959.1 cell division protein FtsK [Neisseria weixii]RPD87564.1 cell division protein FtsK [Neisseria weixii]
MLWTVLIFLLLCAIGGLLWFHYQQDQQWRQELGRMESGESDDSAELAAQYTQNSEEAQMAQNFGQQAKVAYGRAVARLRLLAAQRHTAKSADNEQNELEYVDDSSAFSDQSYHEAELEQAAEETEFTRQFQQHTYQKVNQPVQPLEEAQEFIRPARASKRLSAVPDPVIVPFEETNIPDYVPRKVQGAAFEEITLEDATRSLSEAVLQEMAEQKNIKKQAFEETQTVQTASPQPSRRPRQDLEVIDLNDPALRRTRERVLAQVEEIHINPAQPPRIESAQNALRTVERETIPVKDIPSRWDEIDVEKIHSNLARQRAARSRLAAAVAPIQDYQPTIIQDDEILANLSQSTSPLNRRMQPIRRIDTRTRESVIPDSVVVEKSSAVVQPAKPAPKASRFQNNEAFISRQPAPNATVVEPPVVPKVEPVPVNIPESPAFKEPPAVTLPEVSVNVHVSNRPLRSLQDFLISETEEIITEPKSTVQKTLDEATVSVFEQRVHTVENELMPSERLHDTAGFDEYASVNGENHEEAQWPEQGNEVATPVSTKANYPISQTVSVAHQSSAMPSEINLPSVDLLLPPQFDPTATQTEEALIENGIIIEDKLAEFKVKVKVVDSYSGPVITRYEIEPDVGVRGSAVINLEKDLARSLGVASIRVVETIPGKTCMGLELPNPRRQMIRLSEIFNSPVFTESESKLTLALGQDITGEPVITDLAKAPHLLVAGTTGSGKSVGVNAMILSMLFKALPEDVRMIMIDPKMLELSIYEGIPHLLAPVVTDMKLAANALNWCVNEMEKRYRLMTDAGVRNLASFNQKIAEAAVRGEKIVNPFTLTPNNPEYLEKLPFIVVVVDEFADLMMTAGKKIEELIARLAQKARAAGIHLILATQRPSVDVITGLIKANIPTRIAFQVSSKIDSRTILDQMGAENLLGQGDMLYLPPGTSYPQRVHGAFASDDEVHRVVEYLKRFGEPDYVEEILSGGVTEDLPGTGSRSDNDQDPMYDEAVAYVVKTRKASISGVQRQLRIGYNRAARLVEQMEADGIVSSAEANGNRSVLVPSSSHLDKV